MDEDIIKGSGLGPKEVVCQLAEQKARSVMEKYPNGIVIGSDQIASVDGILLGKPGTVEKAREQLSLLSGKSHDLHTAVVVIFGEKVFSHLEHTRMTMRKLTSAEIDRYVAKDKPLDCAGSYKIESLGISLFSQIEAPDASAIQGLPMMALSKALRGFGVELP